MDHIFDFPQELIDLVLDFTHDDKPTLMACSLVSRTWTTSSRYHMFYRTRVTVEDHRISAFYSLFVSEHSTITPSSIREIDFIHTGDESNSGLTEHEQILGDFACAPWLLVRGAFPSVRHLSLHNFFDKFHILAGFISNFLSLESLDLRTSYFRKATSVPTVLPPMNLASLAINLSHGDLFEWFRAQEPPLLPSTLLLDDILERHFPAIATHLKVTGRILGLYFPHFSGQQGTVFNVFDLSHNTNLQVLTVALHVRSGLPLLLHLLSRLRSRALTTLDITLRSSILLFEVWPGWNDLDRALASASQGSTPRITVRHAGSSAVRESWPITELKLLVVC
ncbi:hypothetical protein C8J57DRAFT_1522434 [Mycena rebaudengoi]|nr:hypothetical protein C8J57DRAFT_1522434 [Mycena rebaudengoi]